jgi:hypothetical protein
MVVVVAEAGALPDHQTYLVAFSTDPDGREALTFQMPLSGRFDDQEVQLKQDTYCIATADGACIYGGLRKCVLKGSRLDLKLAKRAARALGLPEELLLELRDTQAKLASVTEGLRRILSCGREVPNPLAL